MSGLQNWDLIPKAYLGYATLACFKGSCLSKGGKQVEAMFACDRSASINRLGLLESCLAELNWNYEGRDSVPESFSVLLSHLSKDLDIMTRTRVTSIKVIQGKNNFSSVQVQCYKTDTKESVYLKSKTVVIAVPLPILKDKDIKFDPPLSKSKEHAISHINAERTIKCIALYSKSVFPPAISRIVAAGEAFSELHVLKRSKEFMIVVAFSAGHRADELAKVSRKTQIGIYNEQVDRMICKAKTETGVEWGVLPSLYLEDITVMDWGQEPFIRCGYTSPSYIPFELEQNGVSLMRGDKLLLVHSKLVFFFFRLLSYVISWLQWNMKY